MVRIHLVLRCELVPFGGQMVWNATQWLLVLFSGDEASRVKFVLVEDP